MCAYTERPMGRTRRQSAAAERQLEAADRARAGHRPQPGAARQRRGRARPAASRCSRTTVAEGLSGARNTALEHVVRRRRGVPRRRRGHAARLARRAQGPVRGRRRPRCGRLGQPGLAARGIDRPGSRRTRLGRGLHVRGQAAHPRGDAQPHGLQHVDATARCSTWPAVSPKSSAGWARRRWAARRRSCASGSPGKTRGRDSLRARRDRGAQGERGPAELALPAPAGIRRGSVQG